MFECHHHYHAATRVLAAATAAAMLRCILLLLLHSEDEHAIDMVTRINIVTLKEPGDGNNEAQLQVYVIRT